jgi:hypothetical protein
LKGVCLTNWFIGRLWQEGYGEGSWFVGYGCESLTGEDQYMIRERNGLGKVYNWWGLCFI